MKIKSGYLLREVADSYVVVPVGRTTLDFNGMITLNEAGALLWKELLIGANVDRLCEVLLETYDVEQKQANSDVDKFINKLKEADLLE